MFECVKIDENLSKRDALSFHCAENIQLTSKCDFSVDLTKNMHV